MRYIITILAALMFAGGVHASVIDDAPQTRQTTVEKKKEKRKKPRRIRVVDNPKNPTPQDGDDMTSTMGDDVVEVHRAPVVSDVEFSCPGASCTPERLDSLLAQLYENNTVSAFEDFFDSFIAVDTVPLTSDIPDKVYEGRLRGMFPAVPMPFNPIVKQYIIAYTTTRKQTVGKVLSRSQYYFPIIEQELAASDMPLELRMLPVIESALSPVARSRVGATGLWQFMYTTGRHYGMEITSFVDQRCDPVVSTRAACRYLKDLYGMYGDWFLAIAAYNCGPGNVNKAMKKAGEGARTFWDIYDYLPRETRGYVPSFIAASYAYTYHRLHDIDIIEEPLPLATDTIVVNRVMHLKQISSTIDMPLETLRCLNPQYKMDIIPAMDRHYTLVLPQHAVSQYLDNEKQIMAKDTVYMAEYLKPSNIDKTRREFNLTSVTHRVRSGENLGIIARKYGVTVKQIINWNKLRNPNSLRVGQRLEIYR